MNRPVILLACFICFLTVACSPPDSAEDGDSVTLHLSLGKTSNLKSTNSNVSFSFLTAEIAFFEQIEGEADYSESAYSFSFSSPGTHNISIPNGTYTISGRIIINGGESYYISRGVSVGIESSSTITMNFESAEKYLLFNIGGGTFSSDQNITLSTASNSEVSYTNNSSSSQMYSSPIVIAGDGTEVEIEASTTIDGFEIKRKESFTIAYDTVSAPSFTSADGVYTTASTFSITGPAGATIHYTINDGDPDETDLVYTQPISFDTQGSKDVRAIAVESGKNNSSVVTANYSIDNGYAAQPTFNVADGSFGFSQEFEISTTTVSGDIYYNIDSADDPNTNDILYTEPISFDSPGTRVIKAVTTHHFHNTGSVATLNATIAAPTEVAYCKPGHNDNNFEYGRLDAEDDTMAISSMMDDSEETDIFNGSSQVPADPGAGGITERGIVYVYRNNGTAWVQEAFLIKDFIQDYDHFGSALAFNNGTLVVGAEQDRRAQNYVSTFPNTADLNEVSSSGAAHVFYRNGGNQWSYQAFIKPWNPQVDVDFGQVLAIEDDTIVVGVPWEDNSIAGIYNSSDVNIYSLTNNTGANQSGALYVYERNGVTWDLQTYIKPAVVEAGSWLGVSVALDGDTIVAGASEENNSNATILHDESQISATYNDIGGSPGAAYVYNRSGDGWAFQAYLKHSDSDYKFGESVAIDGDTIVVGSPREDTTANDSGAAYVYTRTGSTWSLHSKLKASNPDTDDDFGYQVAIEGKFIAVSAPGEDSRGSSNITSDSFSDDDSGTNNGAVYIFRLRKGTWKQIAYLKPSNNSAFYDGTRFGRRGLRLNNGRAFVSAVEEKSNATGISPTSSTDTSLTNSGASYIIRHF